MSVFNGLRGVLIVRVCRLEMAARGDGNAEPANAMPAKSSTAMTAPSPDPLTAAGSYFHASIRVKAPQICVQVKLLKGRWIRGGIGRKEMRNSGSFASDDGPCECTRRTPRQSCRAKARRDIQIARERSGAWTIPAWRGRRPDAHRASRGG